MVVRTCVYVFRWITYMLISAKVLGNYRNGNVNGMANGTTVHAEYLLGKCE